VVFVDDEQSVGDLASGGRLHTGLGYKTPNEVYTEYLNRQQAM
jgi:hypothetical protein